MPFVDADEQAIINLVLQAAAWSLPASWHIALSTTTPTDAGGNFTEPSTGAYARVSVTRDAVEWASASGTAPAAGSNANAIAFPEATASWGTITHWGLFDAATAGTLRFWEPLTTSKAVGSGDIASFAAGALIVRAGKPADFV